MTAAVLTCAASIVSAQTVTSANIVGYTKVNAVGGELSLVALNLDAGGGSLQDLIGTDVPSLSSVFLWNKGTGAYDAASLNARGSWTPNLVVSLGDAFWIQASGIGTNELILSGEVLSGSNTWTIAAGTAATGYYYPVDKNFTTTEAAVALPALSSVFIWDEATQNYQAWSKNARGAWSGSIILAPSTGFWIDNAGSEIVVSEPVPFTP